MAPGLLVATAAGVLHVLESSVGAAAAVDVDVLANNASALARSFSL
jgi:hypothetical protein